jgi:hypothetical protein
VIIQGVRISCRNPQGPKVELKPSVKIIRDLGPRYAPCYGGFYDSKHKVLVRTIAVITKEYQKKDKRKVLDTAIWLYDSGPCEHTIEGGVLSPQEELRARKFGSVWTAQGTGVHDAMKMVMSP